MRPPSRRPPLLGLLALVLSACSVDRSRSPVCGMALLVGPNLILQQFADARALLTEAPRGLPSTLPVRIAGRADTAHARVTGAPDRLVLELVGLSLPIVTMDSTGRDSTVYGVLVVDDSTAVVQGVLIYDRPRPPEGFTRLGSLMDPERSIPLYGLRLNWSAVSNARCPLFGSPPP
jgi:hypothetical protein